MNAMAAKYFSEYIFQVSFRIAERKGNKQALNKIEIKCIGHPSLLYREISILKPNPVAGVTLTRFRADTAPAELSNQFKLEQAGLLHLV